MAERDKGDRAPLLEVIDRAEAARLFQRALEMRPLGEEVVPLDAALGRVLAADVTSPGDVPAFDRSDVDGYAVCAEDSYGASEEEPRRLRLLEEESLPGARPRGEVTQGTAIYTATGAPIPRGADAVVMVEEASVEGEEILVTRPVAPGGRVTWAGTDVGLGETVLRRGEPLTSRETGVLAACGLREVPVYRTPRVAIFSTGDEIVPPGAELRPGQVHDANGRLLADAVRETGCEPLEMEPLPDDLERVRDAIRRALAEADVVLLSGGTSKGAGDVNVRALEGLDPGVLVHGVALKPGKPLCLAVSGRKPVVVLPGFPTSAIFTFRDFVAPVLRAYTARHADDPEVVKARVPQRVNSERGRTQYLLVGLLGGPEGLEAFPTGRGSGSVTSWSRADGYVVIPRSREFLDAGEEVEVHRLARDARPPDLVLVGSHCTGLDLLLGRLWERGFSARLIAVGSTAGLEAARRGGCDLAPVHLLDPETDRYNEPFLDGELDLVPGYGRMQGVVFRPGDGRFEGREAAKAVASVREEPGCRMVNRNRGSGTRVLVDRLLGEARPAGHAVEPRSHNAVCAAVAQGRAEWGVAIGPAARAYGLGFLPLREERYDFVLPRARRERSAVLAFRDVLEEGPVRDGLRALGFLV